MHRPAVSAPLPGLFITSLPRRQRCGSGAAANNGAEAGAALGGFPSDDEARGMDVKCILRMERISRVLHGKVTVLHFFSKTSFRVYRLRTDHSEPRSELLFIALY